MQVIHKTLVCMLICVALLAKTNAFTQSFTLSTKFNNDSIFISYSVGDKKGVINEPHKIPINSFHIPQGEPSKVAKKPTDTIRINTLNYRLLDSLVWVECNAYRKEKRLNPVAWNDTIYAASSHHSEYQVYYNILGHGETRIMPEREKEQEHYNVIRVFSAEICLYNYCDVDKTTYNELAKKMITQWKNSPGHNAIMITPDYKLDAFGSAFRYDASLTFTRENLLKYNPQLLKKIESILPDYFVKQTYSDSTDLAVWCTGNFIKSTNVYKEMDWVKHATVVQK
jgi:hypothetical protein